MPRMHNTIVHDRLALTAVAAVFERDLPINPINHLTVTLRCLNAAANAVQLLTTALSKIANLEVLLDNKQLVAGSLTDLAALTFFLTGIPPHLAIRSRTDNDILNVTVHIPFSRRLWWPLEGLPATRRGDLTLRLTTIADPASLDTFTATVEARQVLDSDPGSFLKYVTNALTLPAIGQNDIELTTGPDYLGVLFFATTVPTAAAQTASLARLSLRVDDVEHLLPETRWETFHAQSFLRNPLPLVGTEHVHISDLAAAYTQFQLTGGDLWDLNLWNNYAFHHLDPFDDGAFRLITRGRSRANYRVTADVADAIRWLPVELVPLVAAPG